MIFLDKAVLGGFCLHLQGGLPRKPQTRVLILIKEQFAFGLHRYAC